MKNITKLIKYIPRKEKIGSLLIVIMVLLASFFELMSVASFSPFLTYIASPESSDIIESEVSSLILYLFGIELTQGLVTVLFSTSILMAGFLRICLLYYQSYYAQRLGLLIGREMYSRVLHQPYEYHISKNGSALISAVTVKANIVSSAVLLPLLNFVTSVILTTAIVSFLAYSDPVATISGVAIMSMMYILFSKLFSSRLRSNGYIVSDSSNKLIKSIQEGLGSIRDIIIDSSQSQYVRKFVLFDRSRREAEAENLFLSLSPRYIIESFAFIFLSVYAFILSESNNSYAAITTLGMIAIGAQRLLPLIQQLFLSWANLRSGMGSLDSVLEVLTLPGHSFQNCNDVKRIGFAGSIELKNVSYRYEDGSDDYVLKDISLKINKGDSIGFVGKTGSGKSTLTDLIMGLIKPTIGTLAVDNKQIDSDNLCSWYKSISHVPQDVFLIDASISENIAFGVEGQNISNKRIVQAAKEALIHDVINKLPDKYQTKAGERGVKLSGGQKQRIAIARALYKRSDLLILDEATSALDDHTEKNLLDTIHNLESNLTTIHVAHRINTISSCNRIIRIEDGRIDFDGSYEEYLRMIN